MCKVLKSPSVPTHTQEILSAQSFSGKHYKFADYVLSKSDYKNCRSQIKSWFRQREYPEKLIQNKIKRVKFCEKTIEKAKN